MSHSLTKHPEGWTCKRCGGTYRTKALSRRDSCLQSRIDVKGYDTKGRACSVSYTPDRITRIEVGVLSAVIFTAPSTLDISISLKDYRRIKPLLHKRTKIVGDVS